MKRVRLNFDVLITGVITKARRRPDDNSAAMGGRGEGGGEDELSKAARLTMSGQQERLETYSWRVVSRLKLAVMQLYIVRIGRPHPEGRYSNFGNFQIEYVHHRALTVNAR